MAYNMGHRAHIILPLLYMSDLPPDEMTINQNEIYQITVFAE